MALPPCRFLYRGIEPGPETDTTRGDYAMAPVRTHPRRQRLRCYTPEGLRGRAPAVARITREHDFYLALPGRRSRERDEVFAVRIQKDGRILGDLLEEPGA